MRLTDRIFLVAEGVRIALEAIKANRVRAALTISGIAIGVLVVVVMAAATNGIKRSFQADVDNFGATTFQVRRRNIGISGCDGTDDTCPDRRNPAITLGESEALRRLASVSSVTQIWGGSADFRYKDRNLADVGYDAMSHTWLEIDKGDISPGRNFSAIESAQGANVAIINDTLKVKLFGDSDPIGKPILVNNQPFTVIGVYHTTGGFLKTMDGRGPDKPRAIVPYLTAKRSLDMWSRGVLLMVKPVDGVPQSEVMDDVTATLRGMRGLRPSQPNNFALVTNDRMMETFDKLFGAIFLVGLGLSAVGLLVGGVGVIAIMMISVTERTREIGVRKALGATKGVILWQFLVEAATLTSLGATLGLVIGWGLSAIVRATTPVPAAVPPAAVVAALVGSALTGILFGILPASRAARLDPVEAWRYE
ncbi:MAG: ABC transporter permease [Gemmatimonadaceae bacterium]|nr:ABC transporter permease [Gemmatimonadaceae bacterium]